MEILKIILPGRMINLRIDAALSEMLPDYSRSKLTAWIKLGDALEQLQVDVAIDATAKHLNT